MPMVYVTKFDNGRVSLINSQVFDLRRGAYIHPWLRPITKCDFIRQLWNELCELCSKNPTKVQSLKVDPIIREGIKRYSDQVGLLWNSLADYYIRSSHFEKVRYS